MLGGLTPSSAASSPSDTDPRRETVASAEKLDAPIPTSPCWRRRRFRRVTTSLRRPASCARSVAVPSTVTRSGTYLGYRTIPTHALLRPMLGAFAGLAWSRLRHRWRLDLARWLGLSLAIALALTIALTQALADDAGFASVLGAIGPRGVVTVERPQTRSAGGYDAF